LSKCDLRIVFDDNKTTFLSGEKVSGHIKVRVNEDVRAERVKMSLAWETHGKGNTASGIGAGTHLGPFEWKDGHTQELPFSLELPEYPVSYSGTNLNVEWKLVVEVDIPWAFDPKAERVFIVKPGLPVNYQTAKGLLKNQSEATTKFKLRYAVQLILALAFWIGFFGPEVFDKISRGANIWEYISQLVFGMFGVVVMLGFSALYWASSLAQLYTGKLAIELDRPILGRGDTLGFSIRFKPRSALVLNSAQISLMLVEEVVSGSGTNRQIFTHDETIYSVQLKGTKHLGRGRALHERDQIKIPENAPPSLDLDDNTLRWWFRVELDIENWPDYSEKRPLVVR